MIPVTTAVANLLATAKAFYAADLYTFNLAGGTVLRYSSDQTISFGGNTWSGIGLRIERSKINLTIGVQVDQLTIDLYPTAADQVGSNPFAQLAVNGGLDGCYVQVDRAVGPSPNQPITGLIPKRFYGRVADISGGRSKMTLTIKSDLDLLNIQMPRVLFQPPCSHSLYDAGCTLSRGSFTVSGTVSGAGGTKTQFNTGLTAADGYYSLGVITFTSGANSGLARYVKAYLHASGQVTLIQPLGAAPAAGDAFTIYPGCDKTAGTCQSKFSNVANYRGFPYVPNPEVGLL